MRKYECDGDNYGREFLDDIVDKMIELFGISESEVVGRVNRHWADQEFFDIAREDKEYNMAYHELPHFWAHTIYYGGALWWLQDGKPLTPVPYP